MKTHLIKILLILTAFFGLSSLAIFYIANSSVQKESKEHIVESVDKTENYQAAILLGAKVYSNGNLSYMVKDRADTAIDLYNSKVVPKILISGDHGTKEYDEVNTIKDYLLNHGVPKEDIFMDHAGFDTYDSMYRAKSIFQIERAIVVSQEFHLPRAVYIGRKIGINVVGVKADKQEYAFIRRNYMREKIANIKAWLNVTLKMKPKFLGEQIPITGNGQKSRD